MQRISKVTLTNFKFFYGSVDLDFNRKNILLLGENGSGKSSIYWGLYTFLQSVFKTKDIDIQKYFNLANPQNLINRFAAEDAQSSIVVEFEDDDETKTVKTISFPTINTKTGSFVREMTSTSDFINYRLLLSIYNFSHRDQIDLFPLFEWDIFMFITFSGNRNANDLWQHLANGMQPRTPMRHPDYIAFQQTITAFNTEFNTYLGTIIERANEYLQQEFKEDFKIKFQYVPCTYDAFVVGSTTKRDHESIPPKILLTVDFAHARFDNGSSTIDRPHSFLNEARLTSIALSIRFAILDEKYIEVAPKILVLDDLLISLDMSNRDTVLDLILKEFKKYQLIIMTHDRLFFELAKHKITKLKDQEWKYLEMYGTVRDGIPQPFITPSETYLEKAKKYYCLKDYEAAGNFLRKEAESFCKEFLPKRKQITPDYTFYDLNGLINQCVLFAKANNLESEVFEKLDSHRKFVLNPVSHDSYDVPKYNSEIGKCIETLDALRKIEYAFVLKKGDEVEFTLTDVNGTDIYKFELTIEEDVKLVKETGKDSILVKGMINFLVFKNTVPMQTSLQHAITGVKDFYDKNYEKSDKAKSPDFWDEVSLKKDGAKLSTLRSF